MCFTFFCDPMSRATVGFQETMACLVFQLACMRLETWKELEFINSGHIRSRFQEAQLWRTWNRYRSHKVKFLEKMKASRDLPESGPQTQLTWCEEPASMCLGWARHPKHFRIPVHGQSSSSYKEMRCVSSGCYNKNTTDWVAETREIYFSQGAGRSGVCWEPASRLANGDLVVSSSYGEEQRETHKLSALFVQG